MTISKPALVLVVAFCIIGFTLGPTSLGFNSDGLAFGAVILSIVVITACIATDIIQRPTPTPEPGGSGYAYTYAEVEPFFCEICQAGGAGFGYTYAYAEVKRHGDSLRITGKVTQNVATIYWHHNPGADAPTLTIHFIDGTDPLSTSDAWDAIGRIETRGYQLTNAAVRSIRDFEDERAPMLSTEQQADPADPDELED